MKGRWVVVAALAGLLAGALTLRVVEWLTVDAALDAQKADLLVLTEQLRKTEAGLTAAQQKLVAQSRALSEGVARAQSLADQVLAIQGTSLERLKKVVVLVRQVRDELAALPLP